MGLSLVLPFFTMPVSEKPPDRFDMLSLDEAVELTGN